MEALKNFDSSEKIPQL